MDEKGLEKNDSRIFFSQLLGMSDNISFNLSNEGYNVANMFLMLKWGMYYLICFGEQRKNTSVAGQTGRELRMIQTELERRKNKSI